MTQCLVDRYPIAFEFGADIPRCASEFASDLAGQLGVAVGDRQERHSHLLHIGIGKSFCDADGQHARPLRRLGSECDQFLHRRIARALAQDVDGQRWLLECHHGMDLAPNDAEDQIGALPSTEAWIEMRVRHVDVGDGGAVDHPGRNVGMHVVGDSDRNVGADQLSDAFDHFAIGVAMHFGGGRAVQRQQHRVPWPAVVEFGQQPGDDGVERFCRDRSHRVEVEVHQRDELHVGVGSRGLDESGQRGL